MRRAVSWLLLAFLAAIGCNLASRIPSPAPTVSLWGEVVTVGEAEQADAPAMLVDAEEMVFAWIGADETGVHQDMRLLDGEGLSERAVLPLPPVHPYAQQLAPAEIDGVHMLWLDVERDAPKEGLRLFSAYVNAAMRVERGPIRLSDQRTLRYAISPNPDGSLWTVWSGGLLSEPSLYAQYVDPLSRPRPASRLVGDADWPALARADDGTMYLFWTAVTSQEVYQAVLGDGVVGGTRAIATTPPLERGDRVVSVSAGLDRTHGYLFWNVARADGQVESWVSSGALDGLGWLPPARLGVDWTTKESFETGYNSGNVLSARSGEHWLRWTAPASGQFDVLAAAAQMDDELALVYLRAGEIVGYQEVVALERDLIGLPALATNRSRHLYLAWSQPVAEGYSELQFTSTQRWQRRGEN